MCEPERLMSLYRTVIEHGLGVAGHVAEDGQATMFSYNEIVYVLRNTAPENPGLLDLAVYLPSDAEASIKIEGCRLAALSVPCLKAWVDSDGDIVLNLQSLTGPIGMMPPIGLVREVLPQALQLLKCAINQVCDEIVIAGIVSASYEADESTRHFPVRHPAQPRDSRGFGIAREDR